MAVRIRRRADSDGRFLYPFSSLLSCPDGRPKCAFAVRKSQNSGGPWLFAGRRRALRRSARAPRGARLRLLCGRRQNAMGSRGASPHRSPGSGDIGRARDAGRTHQLRRHGLIRSYAPRFSHLLVPGQFLALAVLPAHVSLGYDFICRPEGLACHSAQPAAVNQYRESEG